jgi:hypothetical protein
VTQAETFDLLRDLARLIRKYGPAAFSDLAAFLKNPDGLATLISVLETGASVGRTRSRIRTGPGQETKKVGIPQLLLDLEGREPDKAKVLWEFYRALVSRRALPDLRGVRSFALDNGLRPVSASARDNAIGPLLRDLVSRPTEDILKILSRVSVQGVSGDRTLERWTDIILDKGRSGR